MPFTVTKLDHNGNAVWSYPATVRRREDALVVVEARFNKDDLDLGYATFRRNDRFIETFYGDRWYNVFAVYDRDQQGLKGWYCNVCRPARISEQGIWCEDLALDLWVDPDGAFTVLDADEFAALPLSAAERAAGEAALATLLALAAAGTLPG